jgi:hypothetical protein
MKAASPVRLADVTRIFIPEDEDLFLVELSRRDWEASDRGRRLDHIWVTQPLRNSVSEHAILKPIRGWTRPPTTSRDGDDYDLAFPEGIAFREALPALLGFVPGRLDAALMPAIDEGSPLRATPDCCARRMFDNAPQNRFHVAASLSAPNRSCNLLKRSEKPKPALTDRAVQRTPPNNAAS